MIEQYKAPADKCPFCERGMILTLEPTAIPDTSQMDIGEGIDAVWKASGGPMTCPCCDGSGHREPEWDDVW